MRDGAASDKDALDARTAAQSAGDYEYDSPGTHGTADERVKFWMLGFNGSVRSCIVMNPPAADASTGSLVGAGLSASAAIASGWFTRQTVTAERLAAADELAMRYGFAKADRRVSVYYFYLFDDEFGPAFLKVCTYFPYPTKVWLNGHEWAKRHDQGGRGVHRAVQRVGLL